MLVRYIVCDNCEKPGIVPDAYAWKMRHALTNQGWWCGLRGARDLCPACAAEPEQEGDDDGS